jgi:hypothetical protein
MLYTLLALAALTPPMSAGTFHKICSFNDFHKDVFYDGPCLETTITDRSGHFGVNYTFKRMAVFVEFGKHQGRWTPVKINGLPGMRYEITRDHYDYSTLDVNQIQLEVH